MMYSITNTYSTMHHLLYILNYDSLTGRVPKQGNYGFLHQTQRRLSSRDAECRRAK